MERHPLELSLETTEGMIEAMASPAAPRKRSGRPVVGGKGESWDHLLKFFLVHLESKTKNGLPGVPYSLKAMVNGLRNVWHSYVPGVDVEVAPTEWSWLATAADAIIERILSDSYCLMAPVYLQALADASEYLAGCTYTGIVSAEHRALFTPKLVQAYAEAAGKTTAFPMTPSYGFTQHGFTWDSLITLHDYIRELRAHSLTLTPDNVRLLTWADVIFTLLVPRTFEGDLAYMAASSPEYVNSLVMDRDGSAPGGKVRILPSGLITSSMGVSFNLPEDLATWAFAQREDAKPTARLLPRRLTVDIVLRRLCKGPLAPCVGDHVLTLAHISTAVNSEMFKDVMEQLQKVMVRLGSKVDPLPLLAKAVYPSHMANIMPVLVPVVRAATAEDLTVEKVEGGMETA